MYICTCISVFVYFHFYVFLLLFVYLFTQIFFLPLKIFNRSCFSSSSPSPFFLDSADALKTFGGLGAKHPIIRKFLFSCSFKYVFGRFTARLRVFLFVYLGGVLNLIRKSLMYLFLKIPLLSFLKNKLRDVFLICLTNTNSFLSVFFPSSTNLKGLVKDFIRPLSLLRSSYPQITFLNALAKRYVNSKQNTGNISLPLVFRLVFSSKKQAKAFIDGLFDKFATPLLNYRNIKFCILYC